MTAVDPRDKLAAAKLWVVSDASARPRPGGPAGLAYLSEALFALIPVPDTRVSTLAADDRWRLYINESWLADTTVPEVGVELAHLAWHLLLDHAGRAHSVGVGTATAAAWGSATHHVLVDILGSHTCSWVVADADAGRPMPARGPRGPRRGSGLRSASAEEYYTLETLPTFTARRPAARTEEAVPALPACGSCCDGIPRAYEVPVENEAPESRPAVGRADADAIRYAVAIAYTRRITERGERTGEAARWAREQLHPQLPWTKLLGVTIRRATTVAAGRGIRTWSRPSRRASVTPDILLPGSRRAVPAVAVVIDTSGSVDDTLLAVALSETMGALRGLGVPDARVALYPCDTSVTALGRVRDVRDIALVGGGGTDLRVGMEVALAATPRPDVLVVFTDGFTPWPTAPPAHCAVVAVILGREGDLLPQTPPWVRRVDCLTD